jgi:nucleotide-binding universal stress UspA family protein
MGYKRIVVGTDGSASAEEAVRQAARLARATGATLLAVTAHHPPDPRQIARWIQEAPAEVAPRITGTAAAEEALDRARELAAGEGATVETRLEEGDPAEVLISVAEREGADLIVVGNKGMSGVRRFLLGSVPNKVSHHAPCDVLIVHTTP